ncbi:MAG: hypothetical protein NZ739_10265 [Verrucomicrobiae bacterium]|nr:hypothetical protein [Verrucomicrobiae bacterium]MDW7980212.1 hypothetical protein [Verrucomicrobiales bacterium]
MRYAPSNLGLTNFASERKRCLNAYLNRLSSTLGWLKVVLKSSLGGFVSFLALTGTTIYAQVYFAEGRIELVTKRAVDDPGRTNPYEFYAEVVGDKYNIRLRTGVMLLSTGLAKARSTIGAALVSARTLMSSGW